MAVIPAQKEQRKFRLKDHINKILLTLDVSYRKIPHDIIVNCAQDLELTSYPEVFSGIISHLHVNSLLHAFEGVEKDKISLDVSMDSEELCLRYKDNGRGMTDEIVKKIYDPFFTTKRGQGCMGLGMHIVYNHVTQNLGGQIACSSTPGKGTEFTIRIPLKV